MPTKEKKFLKDKVASIIFTDESCREYIESVVSSAIGIDKSIIKDNLIIESPRINSNVNTQYSYVDAIYENNTSIINIEINYNSGENIKAKNMKYLCHLILKQTKTNSKIKLKPIYQININTFDIFNKNKFIYKSYLMEETIHEKRDDFLTIIDINVDLLSKLSYTDIMKEDKNSLAYLLYIFVNDSKNELDKLYFDNQIMKNVREKLSVLTEDFADELYYDHDKLLKEALYEEGVNKGIKEGASKRNKEIAKNLIKLNIPFSDIEKATGLTLDEIKNLEN